MGQLGEAEAGMGMGEAGSGARPRGVAGEGGGRGQGVGGGRPVPVHAGLEDRGQVSGQTIIGECYLVPGGQLLHAQATVGPGILRGERIKRTRSEK